MKNIELKSKINRRILNGHPWIFAGEVKEIPSSGYNGSIVSVVNRNNKLVGQGFLNTNSSILIRLLSNTGESIDNQTFYYRIKQAIEYRKRFVKNTNAFRLIYAEADRMPGLIVDYYNNYLVIQCLCLGFELRKDFLIKTLIDLVNPKGIYERSDSNTRKLEGLEPFKGYIYGGKFDTKIKIEENNISYWVDIAHGQKTGFFLDQRDNRYTVVNYCDYDSTVLNCFCYSGGFSIPIAKKAKKVIGIDISDQAINLANENAKLNNVENKCEWITGNIFDLLPEYVKQQKKYDVIILDPPSFAKTKSSIDSAKRGYKEINLRAMKLLNKGGILVTCSCSNHIDWITFESIINQAAIDTKKQVKVLEKRGAGLDHPTLLSFPEGNYLKCLILEIS